MNYIDKLRRVTENLRGVIGFERNMFLNHFNLSVLQPELIMEKYKDTPGKAFVYMEERELKSDIMREVLQFYLDYDVYNKTGVSFNAAMSMERYTYIEWRDVIKGRLDKEKEAESVKAKEIERELRQGRS